MDKKYGKYIPVITMLPAIATGVFAMYLNGVSPFIYLQNIICFLLLMVIYFFILKRNYRRIVDKPNLLIAISMMIMGLSFINGGVDGVHRWVSVGPMQLYVAAIVIPIIIINLGILLNENKLWMASVIIICVSMILTLQPDASMMSAFGVSSIVLLWDKLNNYKRFIFLILISGLVLITWVFLDELEPVLYVEGILKMLIEMGALGVTLSVISLLVMLLPFFILAPEKNIRVPICFGVYLIIILVSNFFGNFPVPLIGYGISPIIGYFISIVWLTLSNLD